MINLLPPETKRAYRYARSNRHILHWIIVYGLGILGAALITTFGYLYLHETGKTYEKQITITNAQLQAQNLTGVQKQITEISNNLTLVVDVLSKQVLFSSLLTQLTTLMPAETNLTGLSISQTQGAIDISAAAKSYAAATQIQVNLTDANNQLFSKADIIGINCSANTDYPCTVTVRALFAPNNLYMFSKTTPKTGDKNGQ